MPQSECISGVNVCVCTCVFVLAFVMGKKKTYLSKGHQLFSFYRASVLIPSYCWLTERYMDTGADVDVAALAG